MTSQRHHRILWAILRRAFRHRLPKTHGVLHIPGLEAPVTIRRDRWGIPHIRACSEYDAWFALGFCQAQDRPFQLEFLRRLVRGELAEIIGPPGLSFDRLARRIGFRRATLRQLPVIATDIRARVEAFLAGLAAGFRYGLPARPLELLLLRAEPQPWDAADVLALVKFLSFALASNWTSELVRLRVLVDDGPEALRALDPLGPDLAGEPMPAEFQPNTWLDHFVSELQALAARVGALTSNNWVIAGSRTESGRPILANDPHWSPLLPSFWYLAHVATPTWAVAGATLVGTPAFLAGHNGSVTWGVTAGLSDNTDLVLERLGADGLSVLEGSDLVRCTVHQEAIRVRGHGVVNDIVLETRRGPIIGPVLRHVPWTLSLRAVWLDPLPVRGLLDMPWIRSFDELAVAFADWPHLPLNVVYADEAGTIAWLLAGTVPIRQRSSGLLPILGWENPDPWSGYLPAERLPRRVNPPEGYLASANNRPMIDEDTPLGGDYLDPYRFRRISDVLASRFDWTLERVLALQLDHYALPWHEFRVHLRTVPDQHPRVRRALALLEEWDGQVTAESIAATIYEVAIHRLAQRVAQARAPHSWRWVVGTGFHDLTGGTNWGVRRVAHLLDLLRRRPDDWFDRTWEEVLAETLDDVVRELERRFGPQPAQWTWGRVRPLTLSHPLGAVHWLRWLFDRGPFPTHGDENTIDPAGVSAHDPLGPVQFIASLRFAVEVGRWDETRIVLAGGQSGHPFSPHYDDLLELWRAGETIPLAWSDAAVDAVTTQLLELRPAK